MHNFDPENPFPLLQHSDYNYDLAKLHSIQVENFYQLNTTEAEIEHSQLFSNLDNRLSQAWVDLPIQTLMTPYLELRMILNDLDLSENSLVVDLGCAYGRLGFLIQKLKLPTRFLGFEISSPRLNAAKAFFRTNNLDDNVLILDDLGRPDFQIPEADAYFIYDFGSETEIQNTLEKLRIISNSRRIKVVGRGRRTRHLIYSNHPWLSQVNTPLNFSQYSIFYS